MPWYGDVAVVTLVVVAALASVLPVIPGAALAAGVILIWAFAAGGAAWAYALAALLIIAVGQVVKYAIPGRRLADAGVPNRTLAVAALLGVVGFFTVPVIGLPLGFVGGAYLAERVRVGTHPAAWQSTRHALAAVGWSILIELGSLLIAAAIVATGGALT